MLLSILILCRVLLCRYTFHKVDNATGSQDATCDPLCGGCSFCYLEKAQLSIKKVQVKKVSPNIEAAPSSTVTLNSPSVSQSVVQPASTGLISYGITIVSRASAHSRVSTHVPNFKGSLLQLPYKHMEFISWVSAHAGRNRELCLSAHGRLPGTLR